MRLSGVPFLPGDLYLLDVGHDGVFVLVVISEVPVLPLSDKHILDGSDVALPLLLAGPL